MIEKYQAFFDTIKLTELAPFSDSFRQQIQHRLDARSFSECHQWQAIIDHLPAVENLHYQLNTEAITLSSSTNFSPQESVALKQQLMQLHPWRKGPYHIFDHLIDTEWRSDTKWQRIAPHITNLNNRLVLDVGCGSGYHCWRMRGEQARLVVGIDPMLKFHFQFEIIKHYLSHEPVFVLPMMCEDLPTNMQIFDTVFSMGVLYHRKSPFEHLEELKQALRQGGELVLETLVIEGDANSVLIPKDRYAQMRNVWFIPSVKAMENWLARAGFINIKTVDVTITTNEEQRTTEWMTFHSLTDFLDVNDNSKTIEGYPAPMRATFIANKP